MHAQFLLAMGLLATSAAATADPVMIFRRNPIPHASPSPLDSPAGVLSFLSKRQNSVACDAADADQCGNGRTDCCRFYRGGATGGCCFTGCCGTEDTCDPAATQELGACICVGTEAQCGERFTGTATATATEGAASTMMSSDAAASTDAAATDMTMPSAADATPVATAPGETDTSGPSSSASASASASAGGSSSGAGKNAGVVAGLGGLMAAVGFAAVML
ncbi:hypothetical protein BST61_g2130 [Cercospora zeina]